MNAIFDAWEKVRAGSPERRLPLCIIVKEKPKLVGKNAVKFVRYEINKITKDSLYLVVENIVSKTRVQTPEQGREISLALASTGGPAAEFAAKAIFLLQQEIRPWFCGTLLKICLLYTSPSPRDGLLSRMPSSA